MIVGLVQTARLTQPTYAAARVAAIRELKSIGYPGLDKADPLLEDDALHKHLLAVGAAALPSPTPAMTPADPEGGEPDPLELEPITIDMDLLPEPDDALPGAALPLWDAYRARKREADAKQAETEKAEAQDEETERANERCERGDP